jgi:hypothetical protein
MLTNPTISYGGQVTLMAGVIRAAGMRIIPRAVSADAQVWLYNDFKENAGNSSSTVF